MRSFCWFKACAMYGWGPSATDIQSQRHAEYRAAADARCCPLWSFAAEQVGSCTDLARVKATPPHPHTPPRIHPPPRHSILRARPGWTCFQASGQLDRPQDAATARHLAATYHDLPCAVLLHNTNGFERHRTFPHRGWVIQPAADYGIAPCYVALSAQCLLPVYSLACDARILESAAVYPAPPPLHALLPRPARSCLPNAAANLRDIVERNVLEWSWWGFRHSSSGMQHCWWLLCQQSLHCRGTHSLHHSNQQQQQASSCSVTSCSSNTPAAAAAGAAGLCAQAGSSELRRNLGQVCSLPAHPCLLLYVTDRHSIKTSCGAGRGTHGMLHMQ
jgi:hypothetical protein